MKALIGYTGFVGSNIMQSQKFDEYFNSKNIQDISKKDQFDLVVCSAIPSAMWLANNDPEKDLEQILQLLNHLKSCQIKKFILISTIAVYKNPVHGFDEMATNQFEQNLAYGKNRRQAEVFVQDNFQDHHILRLPALFGDQLKKNLIYDLLNPLPSFFNEMKFSEIVGKLSVNKEFMEVFSRHYNFQEQSNTYSLSKDDISFSEKTMLVNELKKIKSTSLQFTNPESQFQFYNLVNLWQDIQKCIDNNIELLNLTSEPLFADEVAEKVFGDHLTNREAKKYVYDMKSNHFDLWAGQKGYLYSRQQVLSDLLQFKESLSWS